MRTPTSSSSDPQPASPRPPTPSNRTARPTPVLSNTKLLLVDFRNGEAVAQHPDLVSHVQQGWRIRSATPRLVESEGTKLLVILERQRTAHT